MKETFSGAELRAHAMGGMPQGFERHHEAPKPPRPTHPGWFILFLIALGVAVASGVCFYLFFYAASKPQPASADGARPPVARLEAAPGSVATPTQTPPKKGADANAEDKPVSKAVAAKAMEYLRPRKGEMVQLFEYVRSSPHVNENALYAKIMKQVNFVFDEEDDRVNAFATIAEKKDTKDAVPLICLQGGAVRFGRAASLAVAAEACGDVGAAARFIAALKPSDCAKMDKDGFLRLIKDAGLVPALLEEKTVAQAKSISAGLLLGILAHESGHQALGHVLKSGPNTNLEISRNQEREADSFASSIISSSPFGEYILGGTLFWHYALAMQEDAGEATTHPHSRERLENFVRNNSDLARAYGIELPKN